MDWLKEGMKFKVKRRIPLIFIGAIEKEDIMICKKIKENRIIADFKKYADLTFSFDDLDLEETAKLNGIDFENKKSNDVLVDNEIKKINSSEINFNKNFGFVDDKEMEKWNKEYNPKYDKDKLDWTLLPICEVEEIVKVLNYGVNKYGVPNAWQGVENAQKLYLSATYRHLVEYTKGNKIDEESGLSHLSHLATNIIFLMWFENNKD